MIFPGHILYRKIIIFLLVLIFFTLSCAGLDRYLSEDHSYYRLPWEGGIKLYCIQGNNGNFSHKLFLGEYAYDFMMPEGTVVLAARRGKVVSVNDQHSKSAIDKKPSLWNKAVYAHHGNKIIIDHGDGTYAYYIHLKKNGALVKKGDVVEQGQAIGIIGVTGSSWSPHLHFMIRNSSISFLGTTLPVAFYDIDTNGGIPLKQNWYISGNRENRERSDEDLSKLQEDMIRDIFKQLRRIKAGYSIKKQLTSDDQVIRKYAREAWNGLKEDNSNSASSP